MKRIIAILCCMTWMIAAQAQEKLNINEIGSFIAAQTAEEWTSKFRSEHPGTSYGYTYGKGLLSGLINTKGSEGIRIYFGLNDSGNPKLIFRSADQLGAGMGFYYDEGRDCPDYCPGQVGDQLNSTVSAIGNRISDETAKSWIARYRGDASYGIHSVLYGKDLINELLEMPGAEGIHFASALDGEGQFHLILSAVDKSLNVVNNSFANEGRDCPSFCPGEVGGVTSAAVK